MIKKHSLKHILLRKSYLLAAAFISICVLFIGGCSDKLSTTPDQSDSINTENATKNFNAFTENLLKNELKSNTLSLHYTAISPAALGIDDYEISIGSYSTQSMNNSYNQVRQYQEQLSSIPYDYLSNEDKITYDIINWYFSHQIDPSEFPYFDEPLSKTIGIQSQLPILFCEYQFRNQTDIDDYLKLLSLFPSYFDEIITYEQEKSANGKFMADFSADRIMKSIEAFLSQTSDHYLITSFAERLNSVEGLSEEQKNNYITANNSIIIDSVFPAYQKLLETLKSLSTTGTNSGGLCNFENGATYYEKLLQKSIGTQKSASELIAMVDKKLSDDLDKLGTLLTSNTSLIENLNNLNFEMTQPEEILNYLQSEMKADFPVEVDCKYNIKQISKSLQTTLSPAFYLAPPIDSANENTIYINPSYNTESLTLYSTLAHEGFPGHMYQNLFSSSKQTNPVRALFSFTGYSEGYATYAELQSYNYLNFDKNINQILSLSNSITLAIYARLDLAIHYEGYNYNQTHDYLVKYGITDQETTTEIYQSIVEQPGNYMCYYGGCCEFNELLKKYKKNHSDFSLKEFHNYILSIGDAPFEILEKYMN